MKIASFIWFLLIGSLCFSQNRANIWLLGAQSVNELSPKGGIDFNAGFADTFQHIRPMGFFITNASICDTNGQLLIYTDGIFIGNKNHDTLQNSWDFNNGEWTVNNYYGGLDIPQAVIILPLPESPDKYILFHVSGEYFFAHGNYDGGPLHLNYSIVDMTLDSGQGGVALGEKDLLIINDTLSQGRLTACKHGNGRDWWVIAHKYYSDIFYKLLVTPDGIYGPYQQQIGSVYTSNDIFGMAVFSPDGSKYVTVQNDNTAELYDFDRCSGEFSNPIPLAIEDIELTLSGAISSNNQFLYINTYSSVFQFNLWATDIQSSMIKIAAWDSSYLPTATYFFLQQLAPDNKIYISTFNGTKVFHVINEPDSEGLTCNLVQNGFALSDSRYNVCVPNFQNYDLGPLPGSLCDTLYSSSNLLQEGGLLFNIQPNPVSEWLNIVYTTEKDALLELFDIYGKGVASISLFPYFKNRLVNVSDLPAGVYLGSVTQNGKRIWSEKVVIAK